MAARADEKVAEAELESADSNYTLESSLTLQAGYVEPNDLSSDKTHDDNLAKNASRIEYLHDGKIVKEAS